MKRKESKSEKRGTATRTQRALARGFLLALGAAMVMVFAPAQSAQGAAGQQVRAGQRLFVVEAMKMEHTVTAPVDGTVTEINVQKGQSVGLDEQLAVVTAREEA